MNVKKKIENEKYSVKLGLKDLKKHIHFCIRQAGIALFTDFLFLFLFFMEAKELKFYLRASFFDVLL